MTTLDLPPDPKLAAVANRRRQQEELRKLRIFNPRQRLIGIDIEALEQQVHNLKLAKAEEKDKDKAFVQQLTKVDQMAVLLEKQQADEIRRLKTEIDNFRKTEQQTEYRREFDLYDPDLKKKELPARISDEDPRCTVSGIQRFEGEDLRYTARIKQQKEQLRDWLQQQMMEKRMNMDKINAEERQLEKKLHQLDQYAIQMEKSETHCRRNIVEDEKHFNKFLSEEQRHAQRQKEIAENMEKLQEIYYNYYGDFLSENPNASRSSFGPHRVVPDRWKGMTPAQLQEYYDGQKLQMIENKRLKEEEHQNFSKWDQMRLAQERQTILLERDQKRQIRELNKNILQRNHELAQEQKMHKEYLDNEVYSNVPTDDYYAQFNTSTR